jgi:hypothetical protein
MAGIGHKPPHASGRPAASQGWLLPFEFDRSMTAARESSRSRSVEQPSDYARSTQSEQRIRQKVEKHGKDKRDSDAQVRLPPDSR